MKATEAKLLTILQNAPQFVIPIYQRAYSWKKAECQTLWDDILRAGRDDVVQVHFVGSVVYIAEGLGTLARESPLLVIDGQQRLTTVTLLLEALARRREDAEPSDDFSSQQIRYKYLRNQYARGDRRFKLLLTRTDRDTLLAIVQQAGLPTQKSDRIVENFAFFEDRLDGLKGDYAAVYRGLSKLMLVDIALSREHDNPQLIFESMNSTGRELTQADLVRNFVLMGLEPDRQADLYETAWRPMEERFGQQAYGEHFDSFMRHYLTLKTGAIPKLKAIYEAFKAYSRDAEAKGRSFDELVRELNRYAGYYCNLALGQEKNPELAAALAGLRELNVDVVYPFLLELYADHADGTLSAHDLGEAVRLIEAYVFRRAVCSIATNSHNKTFSSFGRSLKKDRYLESVKAHFLLLPSYRRFPTDEEFARELKSRDLYNFQYRSYWLRRIENFDWKEPVPVENFEIEHILPQNPNLSPGWQKVLGEDWKTTQEALLHTLGNLTLTAYNKEYSDKPFLAKRDHEKGFKKSKLWLNEELGELKAWDAKAISERADRLAGRAVQVWRKPSLEGDVLDAYREKPTGANQYGLDDHLHLKGGKARELFDALRERVLALDPNVNEEILKVYIAFKAETNFADVIPQQARLKITLNINPHEVHDPRGICQDVSGVGRWGNGDTQVLFEDSADLPYVVGLIRQAFERQMGEDG